MTNNIAELFELADAKFGNNFETTTDKRVGSLFERLEKVSMNKAIKACFNHWNRTKTPTKVTDAESLQRLRQKFIIGQVSKEEAVKVLQKALSK